MTNIAITFSQGHPDQTRTFYHFGHSVPQILPLAVDLLGLSKKALTTLNKGFVADIYLLLSYPVEVSKRGEI